jgi:UV excision repair protein RAD23
MKCKLKTLKGEAFEVTVEGGTTILQVKEMAAASENGVKGEWDASTVKLIFQGKVLEDAKDLASYSIGEGDFMVVMASKKKPAPAAAAPAVPAAAPATPAPAAEPAATPAPAPAPVAAPRTEFSPEATAAIDNLVEMGYARDQVQAAMVAAFMNPDRAVQYLEEGIPAAMDTEEPGGGDADGAADEPPPSSWEELAASAQFRSEVQGIGDQAALQTVRCSTPHRAPPYPSPHRHRPIALLY